MAALTNENIVQLLVKSGKLSSEDMEALEILQIDEELKMRNIEIPEPTLHIVRGKEKYCCNIPARYTPDGKRRQVTGATPDECKEKFKKKALELIEEKEKRETEKVEKKKKSQMTIDDVFEEWWDYRKGAVKGTTLTMNRSLYKKYIEGTKFGQLRIKTATQIDYEEFLQTLYQKNLSVKTVKITKSMLSVMLDYAIAKRYAYVNDAKLVKVNPGLCAATKPRCTEAWTDAEIAMIEKCSEEQWREKKKYRHSAIIPLLSYTGLRIGELLALRWSDIDMEAGTLTVDKTYSRFRGEDEKFMDYEGTPKTPESRRKLRLNNKALYWLQQIKERNEYHDIPTGQDDKIIKTKKEGVVRQCYVDIKLKVFCEAMDIPYKSSHACRRTYTSRLLDGHMPVSEVSARLGHKNTSTTLNSYYKIRRSQADQMEQENAIFGATASNTLHITANPDKIKAIGQ